MQPVAKPDNARRLATCKTCGIIVHVGYHGLSQDDKAGLRGEGHQVEELPNLPTSEAPKEEAMMLVYSRLRYPKMRGERPPAPGVVWSYRRKARVGT